MTILSKALDWVMTTLVETIGGAIKLFSILLVLMFLRALFMGKSFFAIKHTRVLLRFALAVLAGSFIYAALAPLRKKSPAWHYAAWSLGGLVALPVFMFIAELATDPVWWMLWGAMGALTDTRTAASPEGGSRRASSRSTSPTRNASSIRACR